MKTKTAERFAHALVSALSRRRWAFLVAAIALFALSGRYAAGHLKGAVNIPLSQFRDRIGEVPRDRPVYLHCRTSQRSYYALCELRGRGWRNVVNISGSFLGICLYEYFNDRTTGREPIVTAYNFN